MERIETKEDLFIKEEDYQKIKKEMNLKRDYFTLAEITNIYKKVGEI